MFFKNLVEKYKSRYTISYLDLADAGESNRLIVHIASIALLAFSAKFKSSSALTKIGISSKNKNKHTFFITINHLVNNMFISLNY